MTAVDKQVLLLQVKALCDEHATPWHVTFNELIGCAELAQARQQ